MPYASYPLHFSQESAPAAVDGWFATMAAFYSTLPPDDEPDSRFPLFVTLGSQSIKDTVLHPLKRGNGRRGFTLLNGSDDYEAWLGLEASGTATSYAKRIPRAEVTYGPLGEAHPNVQLEIEARPRELGDAVPSVWTFDDEGAQHPGNVNDLTILEAVAAAVASAFEASPDDACLFAEVDAQESVSRTVDAGGENMEVTLSTKPLSPEAALPPAALLDALRAINNDDGWLVESDERHFIEYRLGRRFARSPEAADLEGGEWHWHTLSQWAASHIGCTVAALDANGLEQVVYDIVPRKLSADADFAHPFIECLRAFYRWLAREYAMPQAPACLAILDAPDAVNRLEILLGDSANFDPAKAMVMEARAMGIDPSTPEGAMKMREQWNARLTGTRPSLSGFDPFEEEPSTTPSLTPAAKRKRNDKRKAARKARKKNR